jgi:formylmethanofuran dehydrogenase subunit A
MSDWPQKIAEIITPRTGLTLFDLSALLSANPARLLGLGDRKGHLGAGADADIVCFSSNPEKIGMDTFNQPKFMIKSGFLIINNSKFTYPSEPSGRIYWKSGIFKKDSIEKLRKKLNNFYDKRFSMHLSSLENRVTPNMEKL